MLVYLDNCCFNRPFDDQKQMQIRLETEAKLIIQAEILTGKVKLSWSYILDYENSANPFPERKETIAQWRKHASFDTGETPALLKIASKINSFGVKAKDSLHIASSIILKCDYFISTDIFIIKKLANFGEMRVLNPIDFLNFLKQD